MNHFTSIFLQKRVKARSFKNYKDTGFACFIQCLNFHVSCCCLCMNETSYPGQLAGVGVSLRGLQQW